MAVLPILHSLQLPLHHLDSDPVLCCPFVIRCVPILIQLRYLCTLVVFPIRYPLCPIRTKPQIFSAAYACSVFHEFPVCLGYCLAYCFSAAYPTATCPGSNPHAPLLPILIHAEKCCGAGFGSTRIKNDVLHQSRIRIWNLYWIRIQTCENNHVLQS